MQTKKCIYDNTYVDGDAEIAKIVEIVTVLSDPYTMIKTDAVASARFLTDLLIKKLPGGQFNPI